MVKTRKYRAIRACHFAGRYWYGPERPGAALYIRYPGMPEPPKYFKEVVEDIDVIKTKDTDSLMEEQLRAMTKEQIKKKIWLEYGVQLDAIQEQEQLIVQALQVIADPSVPRKAAGEIAGPPKEKVVSLPSKPVSELSPDELEKTKNKDLAAMILRDRGVKVKHVGYSKADLFDKDLKLAQGG